jgi:Glycosyltransferase sugar-binding region containing DXD motif
MPPRRCFPNLSTLVLATVVVLLWQFYCIYTISRTATTGGGLPQATDPARNTTSASMPSSSLLAPNNQLPYDVHRNPVSFNHISDPSKTGNKEQQTHHQHHHRHRRRDGKSDDPIVALSELTQNPSSGSLDCPDGLWPVYDRIVPRSVHDARSYHHHHQQQLIPRHIHFSFNGRCVPYDLYDAVQKWKMAWPSYNIYFHDDNAVQRLLEWFIVNKKPSSSSPSLSSSPITTTDGMFPHLGLLMDCIQFSGAMKIDLWRLLVLWEYGGLYSDIDNHPGSVLMMTDNRTDCINTSTNTTIFDVIHPHDTFVCGSDGRMVRLCKRRMHACEVLQY